eukprot:1815002-Pyramimonas_sp.AAC.1
MSPRSKSVYRSIAYMFAGGGSSHVAASHHKAAVAFYLHGNTMHEKNSGDGVSLEEFQNAVLARHGVGAIDEDAA